MPAQPRLTLGLSLLLALVGCSDDAKDPDTSAQAGASGTSASAAGAGGSAGTSAAAGAGGAAGTGGGAHCSAVVKIGLYGDDQCTPGAEVLVIEMTTAQPCFGWSRQAGSGTHENSSTKFQCYRDRLCYTQYLETLTCEEGKGRTDKESRTDACLKDQTPNIWTRIIGGTEACPEPPSGFECPITAGKQGTGGISAACGG